MKKRYLFWPFLSRQSVDLDGEVHGVRATLDEFKREGSSTNYIRYGSRKHRGRLVHCNAPDKTIYVTGHGGAGIPFIFPDPEGGGESVNPFYLVGRLIEYGLKPSTQCKLKIFTCYSGAAGTETAYADWVAQILRHLQYNDISVFGYTQKVAPLGDNGHTYYLDTTPGHRGIWSRASQVRQQF